MKLKLKDKVVVISGKDRGKKGEIVAVLPTKNQVVVEGVHIIKRHTKPSQSNPKGGIVEHTKPIDVSKIMAIDPSSNKPARIGYRIDTKGKKTRIFKVSKFENKPTKKKVQVKK